MTRSSLHDWNRNLATMVKWSPYASEEDLLKQVSLLLVFSILSIVLCFFLTKGRRICIRNRKRLGDLFQKDMYNDISHFIIIYHSLFHVVQFPERSWDTNNYIQPLGG
jgi:hypothetical protein